MLRTDFSRLAAVRELAAEIRAATRRIDVLINNAAVVSARRRLSADGHELTFAVNHLAPFLPDRPACCRCCGPARAS